ncbi:MAG TPA: TIGR03435 family protein [Candidatus Acidoferrales bacterium]|nr:TIGR03435 family protein [Candidatus Acidoferrales bacterium]
MNRLPNLTASNRALTVVLFCAFCGAAFAFPNLGQSAAQSNAQTLAAPPRSFEVASIKKHPPDNGLTKRGVGIPDSPDVGQFRAPSVTAKALIAAAYDVKEFQISGGPGWIGSELWDIDAKVEDSLAAQLEKLPRRQQEAQRALMLRSLLADRFKLQVMRSSKQATVLALVLAKGGPKLKNVSPLDPNAPRPSTPYLAQTPRGTRREVPPGAALMMMNLGRATMTANAQPISALVDMLSTHLGKPVIDRTGLKGTYQFALQFAPQGGAGPDGMPLPPGPPPDPGVPSLFTALQEQLGLKLESTKGPIEIITIDHIEEPSEN